MSDRERTTDSQREALLDDAIAAVAEDRPPEAVIRAARERVWERLRDELGEASASVSESVPEPAESGADAIRTCDDVQALLPALVAGTLPEGKRLLVEDHARGCIPCRRALQAIRAGKPIESAAHREQAVSERIDQVVAEQESRSWRRQALAAAVLVIAAVGAWLVISPPWLSQDDLFQIKSFDGQLFQVAEGGLEPLYPGDWVDGRQEIRTSGGGGAQIELTDGSRVEIAERSALLVNRRTRGLQIQIDRGSVIVEASEQGSGRLTVSTQEMLVSVKGTIFAVTHGTKGSRVSVIEGEVEVEQGRKHTSLYPGDQLGTRANVAQASFAEELGWSQNADQYLALLHEFQQIRRDLNQLIASTERRHESALLDLVPADTVVYAALPNPTATVTGLYDLIRQRVQANPALYSWWQEVEANGFAETIDQVVGHVRELSEYLGAETVVAMSVTNDEEPRPIVFSEVTNAGALREALAARLAELQEAVGEKLHVTLIDGGTTTVGAGEQLYIWVGENLLVATTELAEINRLAGGGGGGFATTPFGERIAAAYDQGADYLGAVDLARIFSQVTEHEDPNAVEALEISGFSDVTYLVVERHHENERAYTAAELSFTGPRRGLASWLAAPAPMGSLEFISPDATFVSAFLSQDPSAMLEQMFTIASREDETFEAELAKVETELGLSIRDDLAAPLGGEAAFAIDGPALPVPSWKLIAEVYDPERFQWTIQTLLGKVAEEADEGTELGIEESVSNGRIYYRLYGTLPEGLPISGAELFYTYVDGYLVAAPSIALVERAIQYRDSHTSILTSEDFLGLLPTDGYIDFSAVVFNRIGEAVKSFLDKVPMPEGLTEEQSAKMQQMLGELAESSGPSLYALYGDDDRIRLASNSPALVPFAGLGSVFGMSAILDQFSDSGVSWP